MNKLDWCKNQKKGFELVTPNENLYISYLAEADYNIMQMIKVDGKLKVVLGYYACYSALYALLMRVGIKCEIHDCTLALGSSIDVLSKFDGFLQDLKTKRIDVQYYLKEKKIDELGVKSFVNVVKQLSMDDIKILREVIS